MCLVPVSVCPDCEKVVLRRSWPVRYCNNSLCCRLSSSSSSSSTEKTTPSELMLRDEPCHPSCFSEHCGLLTLFRYCRGGCSSAASQETADVRGLEKDSPNKRQRVE